MGYLLLDTRQPGEASVFWGEDMWVPWKRAGYARDVLATIQAKRDVLKHALQGVVIASGPGRFSAVRVGVLYAHVLARWFRVPLYEATQDDLLNEDTRKACLASIRSGTRAAAAYVAPRYDREPNITLPRV